MRMTIYTVVIMSTVSIFLCACCKENSPPISQGEMWDCHHELTWDTLSMQEALIGEWEWEYIACYWNPDDDNGDDFKGMLIEFKSDKTLLVKENGQITQNAEWKLVDADVGLYKIKTNPSVSQLHGRVLFCDQRLECNNSYIDGCDNYFIKKE